MNMFRLAPVRLNAAKSMTRTRRDCTISTRKVPFPFIKESERLKSSRDMQNHSDSTWDELAEEQGKVAIKNAYPGYFRNLDPLSNADFNAVETLILQHPSINDSFPFKLHVLLHENEQQGNNHIVSWQPHGRSFIVLDRNEFVKHTFQDFFRISKFESFQRQLNHYGFRRITIGPDKGGYYHESFIRDRPDLCCEIRRRRVKDTHTHVHRPAMQEIEPDPFRISDTLLPIYTKQPLRAPIASASTDYTQARLQSWKPGTMEATNAPDFGNPEHNNHACFDPTPVFAGKPTAEVRCDCQENNPTTSQLFGSPIQLFPVSAPLETSTRQHVSDPNQMYLTSAVLTDLEKCFEALVALLRRNVSPNC